MLPIYISTHSSSNFCHFIRWCHREFCWQWRDHPMYSNRKPSTHNHVVSQCRWCHLAWYQQVSGTEFLCLDREVYWWECCFCFLFCIYHFDSSIRNKKIYFQNSFNKWKDWKHWITLTHVLVFEWTEREFTECELNHNRVDVLKVLPANPLPPKKKKFKIKNK